MDSKANVRQFFWHVCRKPLARTCCCLRLSDPFCKAQAKGERACLEFGSLEFGKPAKTSGMRFACPIYASWRVDLARYLVHSVGDVRPV